MRKGRGYRHKLCRIVLSKDSEPIDIEWPIAKIHLEGFDYEHKASAMMTKFHINLTGVIQDVPPLSPAEVLRTLADKIDCDGKVE